MTAAGRRVLRVGDRVVLDGTTRTVTGLAGGMARLTDERGETASVTLTEVFARGATPDVEELAAPRLAVRALAGLAEEVVEAARWWERHIIEVVTGLAPDAPPKAAPRPEFDPATRTLAEREQAKAGELAAGGHAGVSARTVRRKRVRYERDGLPGLLDGRADRSQPVGGRVDPRVVDALSRVIEEAVDSSSRTVSYLRWKVERALAAEYGPGVVAMPAQATFYRLFDRMSHQRHTTGSARTRRSIASQPDGPYGVFTAVRPGELVQIDSTPLDVAVRLDRGVTGRVVLTGMIDVATRTVTAAVLRPTTKSVDASLLLARTVTPEPMRPGWSQALTMSRSVLPFRHLLTVDERLAHAAARPVIVPEAIVCDQDQVFVSNNFRMACQRLSIDFQPAHPGTPTDKPHIEKMMSSVGTLFAQFVSGYLGSSVERRGRHPETEPLWSLPELQDLLDEWLVAQWQNRPHDGLRDPLAPGRMFTPNEKYAALVQTAGYAPVALAAEDYIELLPAIWRSVNHYGIKINHRTYDGDRLNPLRRQRSGIAAKKDLWEVHHDPYDITRVWLRDHRGGEWITLFWKHLRRVPEPFGELAWDHALATLRESGANPTETEITDAVADLLERAARGPETDTPAKTTRRERRVAARTTATKPSLPEAVVPTVPLPPPPPSPVLDPPPSPPQADKPGEESEDSLAEVIPLAVFDAREEAKRWW